MNIFYQLAILPCVYPRHLDKAEILFRAGDPGDALYIIARGKVEVLTDGSRGAEAGGAIARLGQGQQTIGDVFAAECFFANDADGLADFGRLQTTETIKRSIMDNYKV